MTHTHGMKLTMSVHEDYVRFEDAPPIARPEWISRSRWMAFWQHIAVRGFSKTSLLDAVRFISGDPTAPDWLD
jgi:hypothetical protein